MNIEINTTNIGNILLDLKKVYEEYEININDLFMSLKGAKIYWNDETSSKFFESLEKEKLINQKEIISISNKIEIFTYIYTKYSELGKKIKCNLNKKETIINKLNQCLKQLYDVINSYKYLDSYFSNEKYILYNEQKNLANYYNILLESKENIIKIYKKIEEIEVQVSNKMSKLEILKIEEYDNTNYVI